MKKYLQLLKVVFVSLFLVITSKVIYSQTAGTFSFSVTTTSSGGYTPRHLLAIWIQNNNTSGSSSGFIKTKIEYGSVNNTNDHLATWVSSSGRNTVDAVTGATLTTHGTITFMWDGTNVAGTLVPDGTYYTWLEMAWDDPIPAGKTTNSYSFTKGPSVFNSTPSNTANFSSLSLSWNPTVTAIPGILESADLNVYPNPTTGLLKIDFKHPEKECMVRIINGTGVISYQEKISDLQSGVRTFDLSHLPSGTYYCTLHFPEKDVVFTVILTK